MTTKLEDDPYQTCGYCKRATAEGQIAFGAFEHTSIEDAYLVSSCFPCAQSRIREGISEVIATPSGLYMHVLAACFEHPELEEEMEELEYELRDL